MRIFIDCSYVDFTRQPTGIPRVVLKYIEAGYEWGEANAVDVVPVVTTAEGLLPVRPLPGKSPPAFTAKYVTPKLTDVVHGSAAVAQLRDAADALKASLIAAGFPESVGGVEETIATAFSQLSTGARNKLEISVRPGDVVFYPAYWHDLDPVWIKDLRTAGARVAILVHDLLPITFSKFYQAPWRDLFADNVLAAIENADVLYAVSRYTADSILEFGRMHDLAPRALRVIHNGFDPLVEDPQVRRLIDQGRFRPSHSKKRLHDFFKREQPYLMVGTIEPKKGHVPIIESFERLWDEGLERSLALVGRRGWLEEDVVKKISGSRYVGTRLFWFDSADDLDLYVAYKNSRALVFGSYAEGFGIPMIEAAMSRLPFMCYRTVVANEIAGENGLFFDNFSELKRHVELLEDDAAHAQQKATLEAFSWPSWRETGYRLFDQLGKDLSSKAENLPECASQ